MPSKSKKQAKFMAAVANNPKFAKKAGVPQSVGQEFANADKGRKFKRGGTMPTYYDSSRGTPGTGIKQYKEGKTVSRSHDKKVIRNLDDEIYRIAPKERMGGAEGRDARQERLRINKEKRFEKNRLDGMAKGGKVKKQGYNDRLDESLGARHGKKSQSLKSRRDESKGMEKAMGKGAYSGATTMMSGGGEVGKSRSTASSRGDGIAKRGHTRGRIISS
jgi:hypothetical protein